MHLESISNVFYSYRKMFVIEIRSAASLGMQCESTGLLSYVPAVLRPRNSECLSVDLRNVRWSDKMAEMLEGLHRVYVQEWFNGLYKVGKTHTLTTHEI